MLVAHVFNFEVYECTKGKTVFNGVTGMVGVNVNLYDAFAVNNNNAVANGFEICAELCGLLFASLVAVNDELGAIGKGDFGLELCGSIAAFALTVVNFAAILGSDNNAVF